MFVTMVLAALAIDGLFSALGLIPAARPTRADVFGSVQVDYKLVLDILGVALFAALFWLSGGGGLADHARAARSTTRPASHTWPVKLGSDGRQRRGGARGRRYRIATMADDFRVQIELGSTDADELARAIHDAESAVASIPAGTRIPLTHEDGHMFLYADSEASARQALTALAPVLAAHGLENAASLWRWHPLEERWEDAAVPLPSSEADREREHQRLQEVEAEQSREEGFPEWEVRVTLPSRHDARAFAKRLHDEGIPVTRGWRYLLVGADTEDDAGDLVTRLEREAPPGSELEVEPNGLIAWRVTHPFAAFGGIAN